MPEPFKNLLSKTVITGMGKHFARAWPEFDRAAFIAAATKNLNALELKERSVQITSTMATFLPDDFHRAAAIMLAALAPDDWDDAGNPEVDDRGIVGWAVMPMTHYVGLYGLKHFPLSMTLLKEMTKRSSSEFGIRFFLLEEPKRTLSTLEKWTRDPSQHVRRLVSEGTRPRLPWAMQLPAFVKDPAPILPLLEMLKDDEEEYVRRSVANNLNDIAKDHPDRVAKIAGQWLAGASKDRKKLVNHACRTLIKKGHQKTLKALGYGPARIELKKLKILTARVAFGDALLFELCLTSTSKKPQPLIIDYAIHHRKANGSTTAKVFKWKKITLESCATLSAKRKHAIKKITTRVYYPGTHKLEIMVNGVSLGTKTFKLVM
ncbi:MAG: DNA alkylation repair protein [Nitrospina sp.]|nr:DNA alkylation repair protein [Nitrospina sp.]